MTVADLADLYRYNAWANDHLLRVVAGLSPDEFTRPVAGSYGSVRNTFVHALSAQWGWVARCGGPGRGDRLLADDFPTADSIAELAKSVTGHTSAFLESLSDADLGSAIEWQGVDGGQRSMPIGELLYHAANHAVHHRGQIALLLRELGHAPGDFDILFYYAERHGVAAW